MTPEEHERPTPVEPVPAVPTRSIPPAVVTSRRPPPLPIPPRTKSGQHPAIQQYRAKLESLTEGHLAQKLDALDAKIDAATEALKTPVPPPLEPIEPDDLDDPPTSH